MGEFQHNEQRTKLAPLSALHFANDIGQKIGKEIKDGRTQLVQVDCGWLSCVLKMPPKIGMNS
jgi:hypothetical protein